MKGNHNFTALILIVLTILVTALMVFAEEERTPYGDYRECCGAYGVCKEEMSPKDAEKAITRYFSSKGMRIGKIQHRGRFVEAEIYRNGKMMDKVIFDRKTGRIRSAY